MSVKFEKNGDVLTFEFGLPGLEKLVVDYTGIPRDKRAGLAKTFLQAAVISCYTTALEASLEARGGNYETITAETALSFGKNTLGQGRVLAMTLSVDVNGLDRASSSCFERCAKIMRNGCLVSGSLEDGINMTYNLNGNYKS